MFRILIFGGTTEGRELADFCHSNRIPAAVCVTTGFGKELLSSFNTLKIITGKKDYSQIVNMLEKEKIFSSARCYAPFCRKSYRKYKKSV